MPTPPSMLPDFADPNAVTAWLGAARSTHPEIDDPIDRAVMAWRDAVYAADCAYRSALIAAIGLNDLRCQRLSANDDSFVQRPETRRMLAGQVESIIRDATDARLSAYDDARRALATTLDEYMRCPNPQCVNGQAFGGSTLTGAAAVSWTCPTCLGSGRRPLTAKPAPTPVHPDITGGDGEGIPIPPLPAPDWGIADPPQSIP